MPNVIQWDREMDEAFATLKNRISSAPILHLPDLSKHFIVQTDASGHGIGAILLQEHGTEIFPVAYASRKLRGAEIRYSTIELECLAIVWAVRKFETYLFGKEFTLQTDHRPLTFLHTAKLENKRLMRWSMLLQQYQFRIQAVKGEGNLGADFLSRCPPDDAQIWS